MSIKFKSFQDLTSMVIGTVYATEQLENFIKENDIKYSNIKEYSAIKDIKFSVDSEGNEHILLIYVEAEEC